jgi:hypothetical protein
MITNIRNFTILLFLQVVSLHVIAQSNDGILDRKISIEIHDLPSREILNKISAETGIGFSYSDDLVSLPKKATIKAVNKPLKEVLDQLLSGSNIVYKTLGNQVIFQTRKEPRKKHTVSGYVSDKETGERISGVFIQEVGSQAIAMSNTYGFYSISLPEGNAEIKYFYLGYNLESNGLSLTQNVELNVQLTAFSVVLKEVTVTDKAYLKHIESTQIGSGINWGKRHYENTTTASRNTARYRRIFFLVCQRRKFRSKYDIARRGAGL